MVFELVFNSFPALASLLLVARVMRLLGETGANVLSRALDGLQASLEL